MKYVNFVFAMFCLIFISPLFADMGGVHQLGDYTAQIISYSPESSELVNQHHVIFKYSDTIAKAIKYKKENTSEDVFVKVAIFKVNRDVWVGVDPNIQNTYGKVKGEDFDLNSNSEDTEKFLYTIKRAVDAGVKIQFLYHNPSNDLGVMEYLSSHIEYGKYFRKIGWGDAGNQQMHNKFVIANKIKDIDDLGQPQDVSNVIYTATANIDAFSGFSPIEAKNYSQTGILVKNHSLLYQAYSNYFDLMWENSLVHKNFTEAIEDAHAGSGINYSHSSDPYFKAYFFPFDDGAAKEGWSTTYNPLSEWAERIETVNDDKSRYVKINSYVIGTSSGNENERKDRFVDKFIRSINYRNDNSANTTTHYLHFRSTYKNIYDSIIPEYDGQSPEKMTHNKIYQFYFKDTYNNKSYRSVIGSANFKRLAFAQKGNNMLEIRELENAHPIYDELKVVFYNVYDTAANPLNPSP